MPAYLEEKSLILARVKGLLRSNLRLRSVGTTVSQNGLAKAPGKVWRKKTKPVQAFLPSVIIFCECIALSGEIVWMCHQTCHAHLHLEIMSEEKRKINRKSLKSKFDIIHTLQLRNAKAVWHKCIAVW